MHRRQFLLAAPLAAAGCSRPAPPPPAAVPVLSPAGAVPADTSFITPKPPVDVVAVFPELKPLGKVAVRLHPRPGPDPGPAGSKLGGPFAWPPQVPFPKGMVPVLQLCADDAPPQVTFRPNTDLLQVFWNPTPAADGRLACMVVWRNAAGLAAKVPFPADGPFVPAACRLFPERVAEYPEWATLSKTALREKVEAWKPPGESRLTGPAYYDRFLAAAPGTKAGGYPGTSDAPACDICKWAMDYLLTVGGSEWSSVTAARWQPAGGPPDPWSGRATGLPAAVRVYVCRRCADGPAAAKPGDAEARIHGE